MPLQPMNVTSASGMSCYFNEDFIDGYPVGPVKLVQNQTFFYDPHSASSYRLRFTAASASFTPGIGSYVPAPSANNTFMQANVEREASGRPYFGAKP